MSDEKPTFTAEELALVTNEGGKVAPYKDENLPAEQRLAALTALMHQGERGQAEYAANQALARDLHRQVQGDGAAVLTGREPLSTEATAEIAKLRAELGDLAKLMHRDDQESQRLSREAEPRRREIAARIDALQRGKTSAAAAPAKPAAKSAAPADKKVTQLNYADLALPDRLDGQERDQVDYDLAWAVQEWGVEQQLSRTQMKSLLDRIPQWEKRAVERRAKEAGRATREAIRDAEDALVEEYGSKFRDMLEPANELLRRLLPDGASRELMALRLEHDGVGLGNHPLAIRAFIELSRELERRKR